MVYPAQLNRPLDPQLLEAVLVVEAACEANVEILFWVSWLWQFGQTGLRSVSVQRTIFSKDVSHDLQRYS